MYKLSLFLLLTFTFMACQNQSSSQQSSKTDTSATTDFDEMAEELCACMKPMADFFNDFEAAQVAGDQDKMKMLVNAFEGIAGEAENCAEKLEAKYGDFAGEDEEKAKMALRKACPKIAQMVEGAGALLDTGDGHDHSDHDGHDH